MYCNIPNFLAPLATSIPESNQSIFLEKRSIPVSIPYLCCKQCKLYELLPNNLIKTDKHTTTHFPADPIIIIILTKNTEKNKKKMNIN